MTLQEAAQAMAGLLHGDDRDFYAVSTDTRNLRAGDLYFALSGERFDGAQFVHRALAEGAAAAVVTRGSAYAATPGERWIEVEDSRAALGALASHWRRRFDLPLVAVTGSNGKTTVKDMITAILGIAAGNADQVLATEGNLNNDIGVPLTLLRLRPDHRYAVVEMGMNHAGEIGYLSRLACPDMALITNAGSAHIGMLGSVEAIARAKGEIYQGLRAGGIAVINADDNHASLWRTLSGSCRKLEFGLDGRAEVSAQYDLHPLYSDVSMRTPAGRSAFRLDVPGLHNIRNALGAAAVAYALGIEQDCIARGLTGFRGPKGRMRRYPARRGAVLIDDTYNANPESTLAAIDALAAMPGRRVLVLGDMGELGEQSEHQHARVGEAARAAGIETLYTLGEASAAAFAAFSGSGNHFSSLGDLLGAIEDQLDASTTLLVKGSRFMQMERVVQACTSDTTSDTMSEALGSRSATGQDERCCSR